LASSMAMTVLLAARAERVGCLYLNPMRIVPVTGLVGNTQPCVAVAGAVDGAASRKERR